MATRYQFVDDSGETRLAGFLVPEPGGAIPDPITDPVTIQVPGDGGAPSLLIDPATTDQNSLIVKVDDGEVFVVGPGNTIVVVPTEDGSVLVNDYTNGESIIAVTDPGKLGFFNATPAAQPTGVAVTAAGIHAALVTLGLITA